MSLVCKRASRRSHPRGYLLLEALVGGVIVATSLAWILMTVGRTSENTSRASKSVVAGSLAAERAQQVLARGFAVTTGDFPASPETITLAGADYTRTMTIAGTTTETWNATQTVDTKAVTISVSFEMSGTTVTKTTTVKVFDNP